MAINNSMHKEGVYQQFLFTVQQQLVLVHHPNDPRSSQVIDLIIWYHMSMVCQGPFQSGETVWQRFVGIFWRLDYYHMSQSTISLICHSVRPLVSIQIHIGKREEHTDL